MLAGLDDASCNDRVCRSPGHDSERSGTGTQASSPVPPAGVSPNATKIWRYWQVVARPCPCDRSYAAGLAVFATHGRPRGTASLSAWPRYKMLWGQILVALRVSPALVEFPQGRPQAAQARGPCSGPMRPQPARRHSSTAASSSG